MYLKKFESYFVSGEDLNVILDKIYNKEELTDVDKKRLEQNSNDDKDIIEIINKIADITIEFKTLNSRINSLQKKDSVQSYELFKSEWAPLNAKISKLERELEKSYGIILGSEELRVFMKKQRPDAFGEDSIY